MCKTTRLNSFSSANEDRDLQGVCAFFVLRAFESLLSMIFESRFINAAIELVQEAFFGHVHLQAAKKTL
jgi:hypothetical protein